MLAELDDTEIPLCCLLVTVDVQSRLRTIADASATISILKQLLPLKKISNFNPLFFHCGNDKAEIQEIKQDWLDVKIQLCNRLTKRVVRSELRDNWKIKTQNNYYPGQANDLIL